jgi:DNA gyrase subunit A
MATKEEDFVRALYIVNTHTPVLFFSTLGMVYKLKVYKLPVGTPQSRGKAMINLLPLKEGETISTVMPMPEDESTWDQLNVMFATSAGTVRRNDLSDFVNINRSGKIAMKLEEPADRLIGVMTGNDQNDVLLSTRQGKCIRFAVSDVRVFQSRSSVGVRGIKLAEGDEVISMSILKHVDFDTESRDAYLRMAKKLRGGDEVEETMGEETAENGGGASKVLTEEEFKRFAAAEEFILTATLNGFGKRTSAYENRITGRGGQGIVSIATTKRNGDVVASFPVADTDQVMMITDAGRLIRIPVADIRVAGRSTQGVTLFATGEDEHVTSVAHLPLEENGEEQVAESV